MRYKLLLWRERRRLDAEERILAVLADGDWHHGYDTAKATRMRSGRFYPTIHRPEEAGVVEAKWDELEPGQKYRRRMYRVAARQEGE